jgi:hypothetical protein
LTTTRSPSGFRFICALLRCLVWLGLALPGSERLALRGVDC